MTFIATQAALERPEQLQGVQHYGTHFPALYFAESAPWLYSALSQLWDLENSGEHIRGFGDFRVAANTAIRVRRLLSSVGSIRDLPAPAVNVFSGGGITLCWQVGAREVKYSFWPEGTLTYWMERDGQTLGGDEMVNDEAFNPREPLGWLLKA